MSEKTYRSCVLIPCSGTELWAVPQNCLAEILILQSDEDAPPAQVEWRGRQVPVLDFGSHDGSPWRERRRGSGRVAIFLGLEGEGCEYWGVAIRGEGLAVAKITAADVLDRPDDAVEHASAAFDYHGTLCQVPDLDALQKKITQDKQVA